MPIRFRCVYCDKLLGIARRKAGAIVNCPHCNEKLIVPTPEPEQMDDHPPSNGKGSEEHAAMVQSPAKLFEQSDVDALLEGEATIRSENPPAAKEEIRPTVAVEQPALAEFGPLGRLPDTAPLSAMPRGIMDDAKKLPGYHLSPAKATWLSVLVIVLIATAFAGGLLVGRFMKG